MKLINPINPINATVVAVLMITSMAGAYAQTVKTAQTTKTTKATEPAKTAAPTKAADAPAAPTAAPSAAPLEVIKASDSFVSTYDKYFAASDMLVEARALVKALESRQRDYEDSLRAEFPKAPGYVYNRSTHQFEPPKSEPPKTEAAAK